MFNSEIGLIVATDGVINRWRVDDDWNVREDEIQFIKPVSEAKSVLEVFPLFSDQITLVDDTVYNVPTPTVISDDRIMIEG